MKTCAVVLVLLAALGTALLSVGLIAFTGKHADTLFREFFDEPGV